MEIGTDFDIVAALFEIVLIDLILSGDNAVVIALASMSLPPEARRIAIIFGTGAAILMRVLFTGAITFMLTVPYLRLIGAVILVVIAVKLILPQEDDSNDEVKSADNLWSAIRVIAIADLIMSLDNVVAVAAAADGSFLLLSLGLLLSMPLLFYGSTLISNVINRFPFLITACGALLGWMAGQIGATDPIVVEFVRDDAPEFATYAPLIGLVAVLGAGRIIRQMKEIDAAEDAKASIQLGHTPLSEEVSQA